VLGRILRIAYVTRRATPVIDPRWQSEVVALKTSLPGIVGTWGWRRPCLLLPADCESWTDDRIRIVLGHELAHITRGDWIVQIASELVRAAFWYNPLFWIACARLRRESEQASDDAVLDAGVPPAEYASHLLDLARACRPMAGAVVPVARPSTLEWRIAAMLNASLIRRRPTRGTLAIACAVIAAVTLSASSFRAATVLQPMPLTGTIYDMTGGVLPAVALTLENETGTHLTTATDRNGHFDFGVVDPGKYSLGSELAGFLTMKQDLSLDTERSWDRTISLQVGTLQETITVTEQRKAGTVAQTGPVHIGGNLRAPRKLVDVRPIYPQSMRDAGLEGLVPLGAVIGVDGSVASVRAISASVHPELTKAAIEAVRQWKFSPTLLNGQAVEVFMTVSVRFSLED
jgi:TonB family protein